MNRNKRSLALDLKAEGGPAVLRRLARRFDVVVESFRPGVLDKLGAGYAALGYENPRLIYCALTGYGQSGPYRDLAGHDLNYCAISGALALNGPEEAPVPFGVQPADMAGGAWVAVAGILAALHRRSVTGEGAFVDVSMTEGVLAMLTMQLGMAAARGAPLRRGREQLSGAAACYRTYRTRDGRFVALGALEPRFFGRFCEAAGRPELASRQLERGGRGPVEELEALFLTRTRDEWAALGREQDVCLTPVLEGDEPRQDPQLLSRGAFGAVPTAAEGRSVFAFATPVRIRRGARARASRPGARRRHGSGPGGGRIHARRSPLLASARRGRRDGLTARWLAGPPYERLRVSLWRGRARRRLTGSLTEIRLRPCVLCSQPRRSCSSS